MNDEFEDGDRFWFWNGKLSKTNNIPQNEWFGTSAPSDYAGNGKDIYYYVVYPSEVKKGQPHMRGGAGSYAWMHNNPGNIMGPQPAMGQYPGKFGWHNFMIFPDYESGYNAIGKYLRTDKYANLSILQAFNKYAPKGDGGNDPDGYAQDVANATGTSVDTLIRDLSDSQMKAMQDKIVQIEGSNPGKTLPRGELVHLQA